MTMMMMTPFELNINNINKYITINNVCIIQETPLYMAIKNDRSIEFLDILFNYGADINKGRIKNEFYQDQPPLSAAIEMSKGEEIIKYLIKKGANINYVENSTWRTPLDYLNDNKTYDPIVKKSILKMLLDKEAKTYNELQYAKK